MEKKPKKRNLEQLYASRVLRIRQDDRVLSPPEMMRLIRSITEEQVLKIQTSQTAPSGVCEVRQFYRGAGVCLLKKYLKVGLPNPDCEGCRAQQIVEQMNWIFDHYYTEHKYQAEWKSKRSGR